MIVKFLKNRGGGSAAATFNYLLGKNRDRSGAQLISGDPNLTERIADNLDFKNRYTVGVLSFEEKDLEDTTKEKIMRSFETILFQGLARDQYDITWIEHMDKGRLELNFVIPNVELTTGKRLQPYYDRVDRPLVENWKQIINYEMKLSDPNLPEKVQLIKGIEGQNLPKSIKEIKEKIGNFILKLIIDGAVQNRNDVLQTLVNAGFEIQRTTEKSISIKNPDGIRNIRLEGLIYENRSFDQEFREQYRRTGEIYQDTARERHKAACTKILSLIRAKQESNQRYSRLESSANRGSEREPKKSCAFEYCYGTDIWDISNHFYWSFINRSMASKKNREQEERVKRAKSKNEERTSRKSHTSQGNVNARKGSLLHSWEGQAKDPGLFQPLWTRGYEDTKINQISTLELTNAQRLYTALQQTLEGIRRGDDAFKTAESYSEQTDTFIDFTKSRIIETERRTSQTEQSIGNYRKEIEGITAEIKRIREREQYENHRGYRSYW